MDKRERIDKVLRAVTPEGFYWSTFIDALAKQAIVIECEVEHYLARNLPGQKRTGYLIETERGWRTFFKLEGHHGTPGKALAIIVPLEEE